MADLRHRGYLIFEGFLEADELAAAQDALWLHYPQAEGYFAYPITSYTYTTVLPDLARTAAEAGWTAGLTCCWPSSKSTAWTSPRARALFGGFTEGRWEQALDALTLRPLQRHSDGRGVVSQLRERVTDEQARGDLPL